MSDKNSWSCWSCKNPVTIAQRADADGNCPHCEVELDIEDWPFPGGLATPDAERQPAAWRTGECVWTSKGAAQNHADDHGFTVEPLYTSSTAPVALEPDKYDYDLLPFVRLMRKELHANASKGDRAGWLEMSSDTALLEIIYHFGKLQASVKRGDEDGIREYAADVANMCMMLVDICACLDKVKELNQ